MKRIIFILLCFLSLKGMSQTYNPAIAGTTSNKPYAPAQATPTDARSYYYDAGNFLWRAYQNTTEVKSYLNLSKFRVGQFDIIINSGGFLSGGTIIGGTNSVWYFKDGQADSNLVPKITGSIDTSVFMRKALNLSDLSNISLARSNLGLGAMALLGTAAGGDLSGTFPSPTVARLNGQLPSFYLNYNNLSNPPTIPAQVNLTGSGTVSISGTYPNLTIIGSATAQCLNCNADSILKQPLDSGVSLKNRAVPIWDSVNRKFIFDTISGGGSGGVSTVSFTAANGFTGSFANPTTTPALTVGTSITGLLFGNGTAIAAATVSAPLTYSTGTLGIQVANTSQNGYLSSTDWNTFNGKINLTSISATSPVLYNNTTGVISEQVANTSQNGYLSSTDWNTFNGKQGALTLTTTGSSGAATLIGNTLNIPNYAGGGGSGTVTTFSAGTLSPLFTTSVATATTTPALTFTLTNAAANTAFGNFTGSSAAPSFGKLSLAAMATGTANSLIGYDGSGNPSGITVSTGLSLSSGVLTATGGGGSIGGTLASTQVAFGTGANTIGGNAAFTYNSTNHTMYSDSLTAKRVQSDSVLANRTTALLNVSNCLTVGCSYGTGNGVTPTYPTLVSGYYGLTLNNQSIGGTGLYSYALTAAANEGAGSRNLLVVDIFGFNDVRWVQGVPTYRTFNKMANCMNAILANHFSKYQNPASTSSGSGMTIQRFGTWNTYNALSVGGKYSNGSWTANTNDSIVIRFTDSSFAMVLSGGASGFANFEWYLDGVDLGNYTTNNQFDSVSVQSHVDSRGPIGYFLTNLPNTSHTVKVVSTNGAGVNALAFDYFSTLVDKTVADSIPVVISQSPYLDSAGYNFSGFVMPNGFKEINQCNATLDSTIRLFLNLAPYFPVFINKINDSLNINTISADHIHRTAQGWAQIASGVESSISTSKIPQPGTFFAQNGHLFGVVGSGSNRWPIRLDDQPRYNLSSGQSSSGGANGGLTLGGPTNAVQINGGLNLTGTANFIYSAGKLTIGGGSQTYQINNTGAVNGDLFYFANNTSAGTSSRMGYVAQNDVADFASFFLAGSNYSGFGALGARDAALYATKNLDLMADNASSIRFATTLTTPPTEKMRLDSLGNLLIGTIVDNHGFLQIAANTATNASLFLNGATADVSSPANGMLWYNSTAHTLNFRDNGVTTNLLAGGGGGVTTVGTFSASSIANGASISTSTITFGPADATNPGMIKNTGSQTLGATLTMPAPLFTSLASSGANDSVLTVDPTTGQVKRRSGTFNLKFANGLTAPTTDSVILGGTLNQPTSILGAGFAIAFGTSGSNLGGFSITGGKYNSSQGAQFLGAASTINNAITAASGTVASFSAYALLAPTITSTNTSVSYTIASTLYIDAAPTASTNSTITSRAYALNVNSGQSHFGLGASNASAFFDGGITVNNAAYTNTVGLNIGPSTTSVASLSVQIGVDPTGTPASTSGNSWYNGTNLYFVDGASFGTKRDLLNGIHNYVHTIFTPTTGGTVALVANNYNIINPAGLLTSLTVNLPSSPSNNDVVYIKYTQQITTVTYGNGTVVDGITAPSAGGLVILTFDTGTSSWY